NGYVWSEMAVTSSRPSSAHSFSVWMSCRTCSNSKSWASTRSSASAQNMKASSGSGLCPRRISKAPEASKPRRARCRERSGLGVSEEPALELREDLVAREARDRLDGAVAARHRDVCLERAVRRLERVVELIPLENPVVRPRLVARAVLRVHRPPDGP